MVLVRFVRWGGGRDESAAMMVDVVSSIWINELVWRFGFLLIEFESVNRGDDDEKAFAFYVWSVPHVFYSLLSSSLLLPFCMIQCVIDLCSFHCNSTDYFNIDRKKK